MTPAAASRPQGDAVRTLATTCGAHALHDGYTDALYVLLPIWQVQFGLGYAEVGFLRALYSGTMAAFQVPAGALARPVGAPPLLALGTAVAAAGLFIVGASGGLLLLSVGLVVCGLGSSTQHPLGSALIANAYQGQASRGALGIYNFAGDVGKMLVPGTVAVMVAYLAWHVATTILGIVGLIVAALIAVLLMPAARNAPQTAAPVAPVALAAGRVWSGGFTILFGIGILDTAVRMGFLTFLPFLLKAKGAGLPTIGLALSLVFAGGAAGKLACGLLSARLGFLRTVILTEAATALCILLLLPLPLGGCLLTLPLLGVALNGTSSVLYGTVPELVSAESRTSAFGIFYTGTIGSGAVAPIVFGLLSDMAGVQTMMIMIAMLVVGTMPLAWMLRPHLRDL